MVLQRQLPTMRYIKAFTERFYGSEINFPWSIEETESSFRASSAYYAMDEILIPFVVVFPKDKPMKDFRVMLSSKKQQYQYYGKKYNVKPWLVDTIAYILRSMDVPTGIIAKPDYQALSESMREEEGHFRQMGLDI